MEDETFNHIWQCKKARKEIREDKVKSLDNWRRVEGKGVDWESIVLNAMKGLAVVPICEYAMEFERLIRERP